MPLPSVLQNICLKKSADSLMGAPYYVTLCFALAAFKLFSLSFAVLIMIGLGVGLLRFILLGLLSVIPGPEYPFPSQVRGYFQPLFHQMHFRSLSLSLCFLGSL